MIDNLSVICRDRGDDQSSYFGRHSTTPNSSTTGKKFEQLKEIMMDCISDNKPIVIPPSAFETEEYDEDEIYALRQRDFQTRIFMSSLSINMNSVWLRNHHSDNFNSKSNFTHVRDYFKAAFTTKNHTAAKSTLTSELTKWFDLDHHEYYTYATTLASALSDEATNTSFQIHKAMVQSPEQLQLARRTLILLMDILFSKVHFKNFLHKENNSNIYRLVYCEWKNTKNYSSLLYAIFSFLLQLALTAFVLLQLVVPSDSGFGMTPQIREYMVLALFGAIYSVMITNKEYLIAKDVCRFYGKVGLLQMMDAIVNLVLPVILLWSGFIVTTQEDTYINAVLNTAAFLFIPEIDDQLPALLGYDKEAIIENYLIAESKKDYNRFTALTEKDIHKTFEKSRRDLAFGVPFNDYYVTNCPEQGSSPQDGSLYQPHHILRNDKCGHEIDPSNYVTKDCLLKRLEWSYTAFNPRTIKPRIGYLKLTKMDGETVEIKYKGVGSMKMGERHTVDGVFVITNFVMSSTILQLRFCGSNSAHNFLKAFRYYTLWKIDSQAVSLLKKHDVNSSKKNQDQTRQKSLRVTSTYEEEV